MSIFDQTNKMDNCLKKNNFVLECVLLICGTIFFFNLLHQQSEYKVFYKLMCRLGLVCRLTSVMRSPPARRSRRPCYKSAGRCRFNLCMMSSRGRVWNSGFGCEASFVRCLILLSWMTSCTVGIPRSLWIISLVTYHGASTVALSYQKFVYY
jgi:hypothetical protein